MDCKKEESRRGTERARESSKTRRAIKGKILQRVPTEASNCRKSGRCNSIWTLFFELKHKRVSLASVSLPLFLFYFTLSLLKTRNAVYRESNFMSTKFIFVLFILSFNFHLSFFSLRITCNHVFGWFTKCRWTLFFDFTRARTLAFSHSLHTEISSMAVCCCWCVLQRSCFFSTNEFIRFFKRSFTSAPDAK